MLLGEISEMSILRVCNPDITPEPKQSTFGPFPLLFSSQTDERERAILCVNQGSIPSLPFPCPACTNSGQYKILKRKNRTSMTRFPYQLSGCPHALALAVVQGSGWKRLG